MESQNKKCSVCKTSRNYPSDFQRKGNIWKSCNTCSERRKKKNTKENTSKEDQITIAERILNEMNDTTLTIEQASEHQMLKEVLESLQHQQKKIQKKYLKYLKDKQQFINYIHNFMERIRYNTQC